MLILASASASRRAMLDAAGIPYEADPARVDEEALTAALRADGADGRTLADALAEAKALSVSARHPGRIVLGADSVAELEDGSLLEKPGTVARLEAQLRRMSGKRHRLISAVVAACDGAPLWRHVGVALLDVRPLSERFIVDHARAVPDTVLGSVGGYHVEGLGVQLFAAIRGDHFTIRGLPLLPLLAWLRATGTMPS